MSFVIENETFISEIVELILTVGFYMMLAQLMETAETDLDAPAGTDVLEAAR